ncbi:MAG: SLC13 family permease [Rhodospirillaceae bacterium]
MTSRPIRPASVVAVLGVLAGAIVWFLPPPAGAAPGMMHVAGVVIVAIALWATSAVPEYFTAIVFFFLAMVLTDAGAPTVFSGFHSAAVWMIFGGLVLGAAVQETGFGKRLAGALLRIFPKSYLGVLCGVTLVGAVLCLIIPSNTGRIVIMIPIFMALCDRLGFVPGSAGRAGITLAAGAGSVYPSLAILPAAVPNLGWLGAVESIHGIKMTYGAYLIANFPVIGTVAILSIPFIVRALFPDRIGPDDAEIETPESSAAQTRLIMVLVAALGLWLTDFAHGVSPAWVALGAAVICLMPRFGVVPTNIVVGKVSYAPWFFVAGVIGMGAVVAQAGLGNQISALLFDIVPLHRGEDFLNFVKVGAVGMAMGIVTTVPGQPAIMTTLASDIAAATGWPLLTVLFTQPISWAMAPFAYQLPPLILAANMGGVSMRRVARLMLAMAALTWIVMMPLQYLWWEFLGFFG